jgi:hypothetical protein
MSETDNILGPYIVWKDYGYDGWKPESYNTLEEAVERKSYGYETGVITKLVNYKIMAQDDRGEEAANDSSSNSTDSYPADDDSPLASEPA